MKASRKTLLTAWTVMAFLASVRDGQAQTPAPVPSTPAAAPASEQAAAPLAARFLSPLDDSTVDTPAVSVTIEYPIGETLALRINGALVPASQIGRTETDSGTHLITQSWYGIVLQNGTNTLTAQGSGGETAAVCHVRFSSVAQKISVKVLGGPVAADGRSTLTVMGELQDALGFRVNRDALITLVASAGDWVGTDADLDQPGFQVRAKDGQFIATLRSGLVAQDVHFRATSGSMEGFAQSVFITDLRPSLVTGVINLRIGSQRANYDSGLMDFLRPDETDAMRLGFYTADFATGKIGQYLFTGAYNSGRALNRTVNGQNSLGRDIQSRDQAYPVYGDSSSYQALAQSRDHLYLQLEHGDNYALWGDYNTAEFAGPSQQYTALTRQFHAAKINAHFGNFQATGYYGNDVQGFQRDTLVPDGTSGYYFLSHRPLVVGSETIALETEALNRPGTVLSRTPLSIGADYEIDYDRGSVLFHQPLQATDVSADGTLIVRRIVATYEYAAAGGTSSAYGARLQYHLAPITGQTALLGITYVRQNQGLRDFTLTGADALVRLGRRGSLTAEYGRSTNDSELLGQVSGSAYRLEAEGMLGAKATGRAYYRSSETGFANDATTSFTPGQTRYGAGMTLPVSSATRLRLDYDQEENRGFALTPVPIFASILGAGTQPSAGTPVNNSLRTVTAGLEQRFGSTGSLLVDLVSRQRTDRVSPQPLSGDSTQIQSRFLYPVTKKLTVQAQNDTTLGTSADAVFSDRTGIGLNYAVSHDVKVGLTEQVFTRGQDAGRAITSLQTTLTRAFGQNGTFSEQLTLQGGASAWGIQQALKVGRRWTVAPGLHVEAGYENIAGTFADRTAAGTQQPVQAYAVGQSASTLGLNGSRSYSVGMDYLRLTDFKATARYENRVSSTGSNVVVTAGAAGKIRPALTALFNYQQAESSNTGLEGLGQSATLRLGLAYRHPDNDRWNVLLRYEYRKNPSVTPDSLLLSSGTGSKEHLFALEAIYAPQWNWEFYGKIALRDSVTSLANDYSGGSRIVLAQGRATYRFRYNMDLVGELRRVSQPAAGFGSLGAVAELGYYPTANLRLAVGYTFGRADDRDFGGARSGGGFSFGITAKVNQLFRGFGVQKNAFAPDTKTTTPGTITSQP